MAYVRSVTYTFPYSEITRLQNGTDLWMRLVAAQKLIAQESNGMLDTGVWITQHRDGALRVLSYSEWYTIEDLRSFASDPDIVHHDQALTAVAIPGSRLEDIYETLG